MTKKQKTTTAWLIVIIAFFGGFALANVQNKVPPVMLEIMGAFNIGETDAGWLTSVFTIMGMVTAIPASVLMRKLGAKKIGVIALACAAAGSAIGAFATDLLMLMATRVVEGVGVGMIAVVGPAVIAEWFPVEKRGLPMGLWGSWMMCSQTLLFFISAGLVAMGGWQGVWWFTTIFAVVVLVLYLWKVRDPDGSEEEPNYAIGEEEGDFNLAAGFSSGSTWLITLAGLIFTFCCFGFATYISLYWDVVFFNDGMETSNLYVSILYAIEIPMVIFVGWLLNKIRPKARHWVGTIGFALYIVVLFFCFRMDDPAMLIPFVIVYPFLEGVIPTVYWTLAPTTAKKLEDGPTAIGILNVGLNIGTLLGPPVTGFFIENYGWDVATIPLCVAAAIGAIVFIFVKQYNIGEE